MYQIYSVPVYKVFPSSVMPTQGVPSKILSLLSDKSKCYHEKLRCADVLRFNIDMDGIRAPIEEVDQIIKSEFLHIFKIKAESSYTQNYSYDGGGTSHHYVIRDFCAIGQVQVNFWKYLIDKYTIFQPENGESAILDMAPINRSSGWYRLPNQLKQQSKGSEHEVIQGELIDFIMMYTKTCEDITAQIREHFEEEKKETIQMRDDNDDDSEDAVTTFEQIQNYANLIDARFIDEYDTWMRLVWSIKSLNSDYIEIARNMSKKSNKYESKSFSRMWNGYKKSQQGVSLKTFFYYCKLSNAKEYTALNKIYKTTNQQKAERHIDAYFECDYTDIDIWNEDSKYLYCGDNNNMHSLISLYNIRVLMLSADMGKGKTQLIKAILKTSYDPTYFRSDPRPVPKILCVSSRRSFATFLEQTFAQFNINNYINLASITNDNAQRIIISAESLHKLPADIVYDYVIIDESESFLKEFSSSTMKCVVNSFLRICNACDSCTNKIIFADAFFTNRSLDFVRHISRCDDCPPVLIKNSSPSNIRVAQQIEQNNFNKSIASDLANNKKLYVACASRAKLLQIKDECSQYNGLYYEKDSPKKVLDTLNDVNETWTNEEIKIVGTSPKITIGISQDQECFDKTYVYCKATCTARDLMQMSMRVRHLKEEKIVFALRGKNICDNNAVIQPYETYETKNLTTMDIMKAELDRHMKIMDDNPVDKTVVNLGDDYEIDCTNKVDTEVEVEDISEEDEYAYERDVQKKKKIKRILLHLAKDMKILNKIMYHNEQEDAISSKYFNQMFLKILELCNYNIKLVDDSQKEIPIMKESFDKAETYENIKVLSYADVATIDSLIKIDQATAEQKEQLSKYYFGKYFKDVTQIDNDTQAELFFNVYNDPFTKSTLKNMQFEKSTEDNIDIMYNDIEKRELVQKLQMTAQKKTIIAELNSIMKMDNSMHKCSILVKDVEKAFAYMHTNMPLIKSIFKTRMEYIGDKYKSKSMFELLKKIYKDWTLTNISIGNKDKHTRKALTYKTKPLADIYEYIKPF